MAEKLDFFFKIVLVGSSNVGKTSILQRYVTDKFAEQYKATIGADFKIKEIEVEGKALLLQIWDTAGQERYRALGAPFYRGANACVIVFDVTDAQSFQAVSSWREEFLSHCDDEWLHSLPFFIIGNKCDLDSNRKISPDEVMQLIADNEWNNTTYLDTSAKTGNGVNDLFEHVAKKCFALMPGIPKADEDKAQRVSLEHKLSEAISDAEDNAQSSQCLRC